MDQRYLRGPGGRGACSDTDSKTIKRVMAKRRRLDDRDHIAEQVVTGSCIGDGREGSGCGYVGYSGEVCPRCNGMVLSDEALAVAEETARAWEAEPPFPCRGTKTETLDGTDYDCEYEYAGEITCEECQVNGGAFDPRQPRYDED